MNVYFEVHYADRRTGEGGICQRSFTGDLRGLRSAWYFARVQSGLHLHLLHWVKTRPVPAQPLEAA